MLNWQTIEGESLHASDLRRQLSLTVSIGFENSMATALPWNFLRRSWVKIEQRRDDLRRRDDDADYLPHFVDVVVHWVYSDCSAYVDVDRQNRQEEEEAMRSRRQSRWIHIARRAMVSQMLMKEEFSSIRRRIGEMSFSSLNMANWPVNLTWGWNSDFSRFSVFWRRKKTMDTRKKRVNQITTNCQLISSYLIWREPAGKTFFRHPGGQFRMCERSDKSKGDVGCDRCYFNGLV